MANNVWLLYTVLGKKVFTNYSSGEKLNYAKEKNSKNLKICHCNSVDGVNSCRSSVLRR